MLSRFSASQHFRKFARCTSAAANQAIQPATPGSTAQKQPLHNTLVVYDFDLSMANETSDLWILSQLNDDVSKDFNKRLDAGFECWVEEINDSFNTLHSQGINGVRILNTIQDIPVFDANLRMIDEIGSLGAKQSVVSDANTLYIEQFLQRHNLRHHFLDIYSNPSEILSSGLFRVNRYLDKPHSCHWCDDAPNMCKGQIFEGLVQRNFERILFVCDGTNDYCGALNLRSNDIIFCRRGLGLNGMLNQFGEKSVPPQVRYWSNGDELRESILDVLI